MPWWVLLIAAFLLFFAAAAIDDKPSGYVESALDWPGDSPREVLTSLVFLAGMACLFGSGVLAVIQFS